MHNNNLIKAYNHCKQIAYSHYENFPVASFFLSRKLKQSICAIYAFARLADDCADEGNMTQEQRLDILNRYEEQLLKPQDQVFLALAHTIEIYQLPMSLFYNLLKAFKQDVTKKRYNNFDEVLGYCKYSANPIGRLLLHLTKQDNIQNLELSDYVCTGLQLINFMQDLYADLVIRDRCYIPLDEIEKYQVTIEDFKKNKNIDLLMQYQLNRISLIYNKGVKLGYILPGVFGFEIRLIISGGEQILRSLYLKKDYTIRPVLTYKNKWLMFLRAILRINYG